MAVDVTRGAASDPAQLAQTMRRAATLVGWVALITPFVLEILTILRANQAWLVQRLPDDAFYYLEVARRLGRGEGFTFDGIHETNGFHLLWQFALVPLGKIFSSDAEFAKAALVLGVVVSLAALVIVVRVVSRAVGVGAALFGGFVAVHGAGAIGGWANGMEGPVVLLALALLLWGLERWASSPSNGWAMGVGAISALAVLARFDLAAVVWIVPLALVLRGGSARWAWRWLAGLAIVAVPVGAWWLARWRHLLTTSATVKGGVLSDYVDAQFGGRLSRGYARFVWRTAWEYGASQLRRIHSGRGPLDVSVRLGLGGLAIFGLAVRWRDRHQREASNATRWAIVTLGGIVAAKAAVDIVAAPLWATAWYAAPQQLALPFAVGVLAWFGLERVIRWSPPVGIGISALVLVLLLPTNLKDFTVSDRRERIPSRWQDELASTGTWIRENGPPGRYGALDAGLLGFELDGAHPLVNLDGLVNNYEMADMVVAGTPVVNRLRYNEIDYLVNRLSNEQLEGELACATPIWRSPVPVPYSDALNRLVESYIWVLDVRSCHE